MDSEHTALIGEHRVTRVLIAYDGDPAGDAGASSLAAELAPLGAECLRVPLPAGADINDIAVASRSPRDALGVLLRHAGPAGQKPVPGTRIRQTRQSAARLFVPGMTRAPWLAPRRPPGPETAPGRRRPPRPRTPARNQARALPVITVIRLS